MLSRIEFERLLDIGMHDDIARTLPQYNALSPYRIAWFESVKEADPKRVYWHYRRLFGISGSESIACLQVCLGARGSEYSHLDFTKTPKEVFRAKTMDLPLERVTPLMAREAMFECQVKQLFLDTVGGVEDTDIYTHLRHVPDHPWILGRPDLYAKVGDELWVVNISIPGNISHDIPLGHITSLHHYRNLSVLNGVTPDKMVLACYDFNQGRVIPFLIDFKSQLSSDLIDGGDFFWKAIISGRMPKFDINPTATQYVLSQSGASVDISTDDINEIAALEAEYLSKKAKADSLKHDCDDVLNRINSVMSKYSFGNLLPKVLNNANIARQFSLIPDIEKVNNLITNGIISAGIFIPENIDVRGLLLASREAGIDVSPYISGLKIDTDELGLELNRAGIPINEVCDFRFEADQKNLSNKHQPNM